MMQISRRKFITQSVIAGTLLYGTSQIHSDAADTGLHSAGASSKVKKGDTLENNLYKQINEIEIIDTHEHLGPETNWINAYADVFKMFSQYAQDDLLRAGMPMSDIKFCADASKPLDEKWQRFAPHWANTRLTSYSRAVLLAIERFYGIDDLNEKTYAKITSAIQKAKKPGLYKEVLRDACNIKTCLTQCGITDTQSELLTPLMPLTYDLETRGGIANPPFDRSVEPKNLDQYLDAVGNYILKVKSEGAVGMKMFSCECNNPDKAEASRVFDKILAGELSFKTYALPMKSHPLRDYVTEWAIDFAAEQGMVLAVHAGYWLDFRDLDPLHMIPVFSRHPNARFDLYHLGYPWVRETLMLGKAFSNVWINMCWNHIISQRSAADALDEAIDLLPANKLMAFGGDYIIPENVYGHLVMARENIASVLANRIRCGQITEKYAIELARKWLYQNPRDLYNLSV